MDSTAPPKSDKKHKKADVLLVDDDRLVLRALSRVLTGAGLTVHSFDDGQLAAREAMTGGYDVVVSDIHMPGLTGTELLDVLRSYGCQTPVILVTGAPSIESAQSAVDLGAFQYLTKPVDRDALLRAVNRAITHSRDRRRRMSGKLAADPAQTAAFERALGKLWMAYQPIVSLVTRGPIAYEALVRSHEPAFANPAPLLEYAEKHNRMCELGRAIRDLCADAAATVPQGTLLFVNLHAQDLSDPELFSESSALGSYASRVVLEITERGALDQIKDVAERIEKLRKIGYRVAIDDLGAGYAGLSSVAVLEPDFVKLDMTLTRDLAHSPVKQRLVASMVEMCRDCKMQLVAEGVESAVELEILRGLGCELLQGYHFARPSPEFVKVAVAA